MHALHMISRGRDHSERWGVGVNGRLEPFQKFIRFGAMTRPLEKFYKEAIQQFIWISNWAGHSIFEIDPRLLIFRIMVFTTSRPSIVQLGKSLVALPQLIMHTLTLNLQPTSEVG